MNTECTEDRFSCKSLERREVVARFDGGDITSDGGANPRFVVTSKPADEIAAKALHEDVLSSPPGRRGGDAEPPLLQPSCVEPRLRSGVLSLDWVGAIDCGGRLCGLFRRNSKGDTRAPWLRPRPVLYLRRHSSSSPHCSACFFFRSCPGDRHDRSRLPQATRHPVGLRHSETGRSRPPPPQKSRTPASRTART